MSPQFQTRPLPFAVLLSQTNGQARQPKLGSSLLDESLPPGRLLGPTTVSGSSAP
jgi:hypothetical protein